MDHKRVPVAIVVWDDAHGSATDNVTIADIGHAHRALVMTTIGWLLREDEDGVSIANERCMEEGKEVYRGHTFVPRSLIRSCTPFKLSLPRRSRKQSDEPANLPD